MDRNELPDLTPLGLSARRLDQKDQARLAALCRTCNDFFELVAGKAGSEEIAYELLNVAPPNVASGKKFVFGFERVVSLVGMVDLIDGFPEPGGWYVGILLLAPGERSQGLGHALWASLERWLLGRKADAVRLIVQEQNTGAMRFWRSLGFDAEAKVQQLLHGRTNETLRLAKRFPT
jgi:ribosomal protein S18 acetylase RimI-like enzyme